MSFVSIAPLDAVKPEGNSGDTPFTFSVTRSGDTSLEQSVQWSVYKAQAFGGTPPPAGTVVFAPGETSKTIVVDNPADTIVGYPRLLHVTLSDPSAGLVIDVGSADARVLNDDMWAHDDAYVMAPGQALHVPAAMWGFLPSPVLEDASSGTGGSGAGAGSLHLASGDNLILTGGTFYPVGFDVGLYTGPGSLLAGGVLANDAPQIPPPFDVMLGILMPDGATGIPQFTASLVEGPAHGTLTLGADGQFDYTPDPGFTGIDQFTYKATGIASSALGSADAHALIYVVPQIDGIVPTLDLLALTAEQQVAATYLAFFGRGADADGLAFWVDQLHAGQATQAPAALLANIASSFGISAEAAQQYAFLAHPHAASDSEIGSFLGSVYRNLFNRGIDDAGKAYWTDQTKQKMADGAFVGSVLVDIMSGAQNPTTSSGPHDALALMGRVAVSLAYVHAQQVLDASWTAADNLYESKLILSGVTDTPGTVLTGIAHAENVVPFADVFGH
jgi:hypothetical protein